MQISLIFLILVIIYTIVDGQGCKANNAFLRDELSDAYHFDGHKYYVSKSVYVDDVDSEAKCDSICGTLAQIDYQAEMEALISLVDHSQSATCLLIRGNNKKTMDPNWLVIGDGPEPIPFLFRAKDQPDGYRHGHHCLFLEDGYKGMVAKPCKKGKWDCHYVCEVF